MNILYKPTSHRESPLVFLLFHVETLVASIRNLLIWQSYLTNFFRFFTFFLMLTNGQYVFKKEWVNILYKPTSHRESPLVFLLFHVETLVASLFETCSSGNRTSRTFRLVDKHRKLASVTHFVLVQCPEDTRRCICENILNL